MTALNDVADFRIAEAIEDEPSTLTNVAFISHSAKKWILDSFYTGNVVRISKRYNLSSENQLILNQIKSFGHLDENWDEEGAKAVS